MRRVYNNPLELLNIFKRFYEFFIKILHTPPHLICKKKTISRNAISFQAEVLKMFLKRDQNNIYTNVHLCLDIPGSDIPGSDIPGPNKTLYWWVFAQTSITKPHQRVAALFFSFILLLAPQHLAKPEPVWLPTPRRRNPRPLLGRVDTSLTPLPDA